MPFVRKSDTRKIFIGRTDELLFFVQSILKPGDPTHNIISISGQGGVGKSTLLAQFLKETRAPDFRDYCVTARVDERQATPSGMMEKFADQLSIKGDFEKALKQYKEVVRKLQNERDATLDPLLDKAPELAGSIVEDVPVAGRILKEGIEVAAEFLANKYRYHQLFKDAERLVDPIGDLTKAFVEELNRLTEDQVILGSNRARRQRRVILFFDTFEQLAREAAPWLLDYFLEANINSSIVLVVAGRDPIDHSTPEDPKRWLPYRDNGTIYSISLNSFTEEETRAYLEERGITDPARIDTIWQLSRGLPLYLGLLTSNPQGEVDPTKDVVANFLRWIPKQEQVKRRLALDAALLSRPFNQDDLEAFTYLAENERSALYSWLTGLPFVRSNLLDGRYSYHDVAQELFSRYLYQHSQKEYCATRLALANYYQKQLQKVQSEGGTEIYRSTDWLALVLALTQQMFLLPDEASHISAIEQVLMAYKYTDKEQTGEIGRVLRELSQEQPTSQASLSARQVTKYLLRYIEADRTSQEFLTAANYLLEKAAHESTFSSELLARIYRNRGRTHTSFKEYQRAIEDFNQAIVLNPNDAWFYVYRGVAYRDLKEYEQAFEDFNHAIEFDPKNGWAFTQRGETYRLREEYQQAIEDFDCALALDPNASWAYYFRGLAYRNLKEYEQAISNYSLALEQDSNAAWAYVNRGVTYHLHKEYRRAIEDFDRAIELNPKDSWAYGRRGQACSSLKEYEQAIKDFDQALTLNPKSAWAYVQRGIIHRELKDYQRALQDINQALEFDPKSAWAYAQRGITYRELKDHQRALKDIDQALELDPKSAWAYSVHGLTYLWLKDTKQSKFNYTRGWELDATDVNYGWMAEWSGMCQEKPDPRIVDRLEAIAASDPHDYVAYVCRGVILWLRGNLKHSLVELEQAISQKPDEWDAYFWKGMVCASSKEDEEAIAAVEKALEEELPPVLLAPLRWFEQDRPEFYEQYVIPLLARYEL